MSRIVGIVSGKGGVGKTVVTANVGMALHEMGQQVTLVDADFSSSNLGLHLGLYSFYPFSLQKACRGEIRPERAIYLHPTGLKLLPSSLAFDYIDVESNRLRQVLDALNGLVIVDSPSGLDKQGLAVLDSCDDIIVVTNPEFPAVTDAIRVIEVARQKKKNIIGLVVNKVMRDKKGISVADIEAATEVSVISVVPYNKSIKSSIFSKMPVIHHRPYSSPAIEFRHLASRLVGTHYEAPKLAKLKDLFMGSRNHEPAGAMNSNIPVQDAMQGSPGNFVSSHKDNISFQRPVNENYTDYGNDSYSGDYGEDNNKRQGMMPVDNVSDSAHYDQYEGSQPVMRPQFNDFNETLPENVMDEKSFGRGLDNIPSNNNPDNDVNPQSVKRTSKRGPGRPPKKRGPGRPPKKSKMKSSKRGPGRPPKKRGPGRPRKRR